MKAIMKRAFLLGLSLVLLPAAGLAEYINIQTLSSQIQSGWTQTYQTKWRDVEIDAAVIVPQVDTLPILLLSDGAEEPLITAEEAGFDSLDAALYTVSWYNDWPTYPHKLDGQQLNQHTEPREVYHSGISLETAYVPMSDITFSEICDRVESAITAAGYDASAYTFRSPMRLDVSHMFYYGYKKDALPGNMSIDFLFQIACVPVFSHIHEAVTDHVHGESRVDEMLALPCCGASYSAYDDKIHNLYLWCAKIEETVASDIPLCPFSQVIAAIEPEITAGHIRKIYEVELGYVLYNEPGVYHARTEPLVEGRNTQEELDEGTAQNAAENAVACYYARPMWQVNCLYVQSPGSELRETASYTADERNTLDYYQLLVDAQTGELVQESTDYDRCEFKGFLSWEDVD